MFILLLGLFFFHVASENCDCLNAQLSSEYSDWDRNELYDLGTHNAIDVLGIHKYSNVNKKTKKYNDITELIGVNMKYKRMDEPKQWTVMDHDGVKAFTKNATSELYSMSNFYVTRDKVFGQDFSAGISIVSFVVPQVDDRKYGQVWFFPLRADMQDLTLSQTVKENDRIPVTKYVYPFKHAQPVYDVNGAKVTVENTTTIDATSVLLAETYERQIEIKYVNPGKTIGKSQFVVLAYTEKSLKLVKYTWEFLGLGESATIEWAQMVVPYVLKSGNDQSYSKVEIDEKNQQVLVTASVSTNQAKAVSDVLSSGNSTITLDFGGKTGPCTFLFRFDLATGKIISVTNVFKTDTAYPTDIAVRDGAVAISGLTYPPNKPLSERKKDDKFDSFLSIFQDGSDVPNAGLLDAKCKKEDKKSTDNLENPTFFARSVGFTADANVNRVTVGGAFVDYTDNYFNKGRAFLFNTADLSIPKMIKIGMSDKKSNLLKEIFTKRDGKEYKQFFNLVMEMPKKSTDKPKKKAAMWLMDCSCPNEVLEKIATYLFFALFAIAVVMFTFATGVFSLKAVIKLLKRMLKKQEHQDGEEQKLL